jgi:hypothetical protein
MDWLACYIKYSPILALIMNFAGAIFLLFSSGEYSGGGVHWASVGRDGKTLKTVYVLSPVMFKIGISLIAAGFLVQLINEVYRLRSA